MKFPSTLILLTLLTVAVNADSGNNTDVARKSDANANDAVKSPSLQPGRVVLYNQGSLWSPEKVALIKAKAKATELNSDRNDSPDNEAAKSDNEAAPKEDEKPEARSMLFGGAYKSGYAGTPDSQPVASSNYRGAITIGGNRRRNSFGSFPTKAYIIGNPYNFKGSSKENKPSQNVFNLNDGYGGYGNANNNNDNYYNGKFTITVPQGYQISPFNGYENNPGINSGNYQTMTGIDYNNNNNQFAKNNNNNNYNSYEFGAQNTYGSGANGFMTNLNEYYDNQNNNFNNNQYAINQNVQSQYSVPGNSYGSNQDRSSDYSYGYNKESGTFSGNSENNGYSSTYTVNTANNYGGQPNTANYNSATDVYAIRIPSKFTTDISKVSVYTFGGNQHNTAYPETNAQALPLNNNGNLYNNVPSASTSNSFNTANTYEASSYNNYKQNNFYGQNYNNYGNSDTASSGTSETFNYYVRPMPTAYGAIGSSGASSYPNNQYGNSNKPYEQVNYYNNNNRNTNEAMYNNFQGSSMNNNYESSNQASNFGTNTNNYNGDYNFGNSQFAAYGNSNSGYNNGYVGPSNNNQQIFLVGGSSNDDGAYTANLGQYDWGQQQQSNYMGNNNNMNTAANNEYTTKYQSTDNIGGFSQYNDQIGGYMGDINTRNTHSLTNTATFKSGNYKS
uniref:DUF4774 domain-containing protein n=1 Tax=Syphacia muris TaxID=451379 RepID=A0A0N5AQY6_9BILA